MKTLQAEAEKLATFFSDHRCVVVITGAGVSASSGIPTYRDLRGVWQHSEPVTHGEFTSRPERRQRYWARSVLGWPAVRDARPNSAHRALARLEQAGLIKLLITQNVDRLHQRAGSANVVDLHGRLDRVRCLNCERVLTRQHVQQRLLQDNPHVPAAAVRARPDGDADVEDQLAGDFRVPQCHQCGGILMPDVVFFGGMVPGLRVQNCMAAVEQADAVLAVGSSLQVFSGFRFCRRAAQLGKPLVIINPGITRADSLASLKLQSKCGLLLTDTMAQLAPAADGGTGTQV